MRQEIFAYHEAGHAVMALSQGMKFEKVTIIPEGKYAAGGLYGLEKKSFSIMDLYSFILAGIAAENIRFGEDEYRLTGFADLVEIGEYIREDIGEDGVDSELDFFTKLATAKLKPFWDLVEHVARALLEKQELSYEQAHNMFTDFWNTQPKDGEK